MSETYSAARRIGFRVFDMVGCEFVRPRIEEGEERLGE